MIKKLLFYFTGILCTLTGIFSLAMAAQMWLGAIIITPLGFLFGIGEMSSYEAFATRLINIWWHAVPGLVGAGLCVLFLVLTGLSLWGSLSSWRRIKAT